MVDTKTKTKTLVAVALVTLSAGAVAVGMYYYGARVLRGTTTNSPSSGTSTAANQTTTQNANTTIPQEPASAASNGQTANPNSISCTAGGQTFTAEYRGGWENHARNEEWERAEFQMRTTASGSSSCDSGFKKVWLGRCINASDVTSCRLMVTCESGATKSVGRITESHYLSENVNADNPWIRFCYLNVSGIAANGEKCTNMTAPFPEALCKELMPVYY